MNQQEQKEYVSVSDCNLKLSIPTKDGLLRLSMLQQYFPQASGLTFMKNGQQCVIEIMDGGTLIPPNGGWNEKVYNIFVPQTIQITQKKRKKKIK